MAIELVSKIKPKNSGSFALVDAEDVEMPDGSRLLEKLPVYLTQEEYDALLEAEAISDTTLYMILEDDDG